ncbi:MAG: biotin/lipoyl-binding protein [Sterolibacteriaceae bacterium MAG5]|nr:biotin/lipoyl-binding protein [Candidatus Nitricoxidireducens bremensis]
MTIKEVRMPKYPECWETCGSCANGEVFVIEVHVKPGDVLRFDDSLITLETGKVSLDIPSPHAGTIVEVRVSEGDKLAEGDVIATLDVA